MPSLLSYPTARRSLLTFATLGSLLFSPVALTAGTIVNWAATPSAYTPFTGPSETEGAGTYRRYSLTTAMADPGLKFYGASALEYTTGSTPPVYDDGAYGVRSNGTIALATQAATAPLTLRSLLFIKKEDFLNGASDTIVTFDSTSKLNINVTSSQGSTRQVRCAVYALVEGEWNWYVSYTAKAGTALYSFENLADEKWALYTLSEATLSLEAPPSGSASYTFSGSSFEDIGGIGIFLNFAQTYKAGDPIKSAGIYFGSLTVDAHVAPIPEGSTIGMLLLGSGLLLTGLRFHRK